MAELTWDEKMALSRARHAENMYQNRATHYQGRKVADPAPSGGPRRQSNKPKDDSSNKAKRVISQVFDLHGITETEINTDPNGIVTKKEIKTPSSVFDDYRNEEGEPFYSEARESARSSIATPPAAAFNPEDPPAEAFGDGPNDLSPHFSFIEGRYLTNAEFYGTPADHWESTPINKEVVYNEETQEFEVQSEPDPVVNDTGLVWLSDNDIYLAQDKIRQDYDERDLMDIRNHHPDLFVEMMNEGGFESRPDPHPHAGEGFIENEEGEIVPDTSELKKNLDDIPWAENKGLVLDSIKTLQEEDPSGEAIKTINNFAEWADEVSDEESQAAAEAYLEDLANQPTVNDRFKKAMAIAFAAMLFGDDFSTAMNTGFGVVADDYDEEKLEAQTIAEAEAELAKKIAEEERAWIRGNLNSERDFREAAALQLMKDKVAAEKAAKEDNQKRLNKNVELGDKALKDLFEMNKGHENFHNLSNKSVQTQMAGLREKIEDFAPEGFVLDFRDATQMHAIGTVLKKFVSEQLHFQDGTAPDLATYAEEIFTKIELEQYTNINPDLIAPSRAYLQNERKVNMDKLDKSEWHGLQYGTKETVRLGELIQQIAGISDGKTSIGEQTATHLLYKDYLMFKANRPKSFEEMAEIADNKGVGHFTQFVNVVLGDMLKDGHIDGYGMNFDPAYQAIKRSDYTSDEDFRKAQDNYIIKYIKDHPLDFQ